jgi:hypothetical protein
MLLCVLPSVHLTHVFYQNCYSYAAGGDGRTSQQLDDANSIFEIGNPDKEGEGDVGLCNFTIGVEWGARGRRGTNKMSSGNYKPIKQLCLLDINIAVQYVPYYI